MRLREKQMVGGEKEYFPPHPEKKGEEIVLRLGEEHLLLFIRKNSKMSTIILLPLRTNK